MDNYTELEGDSLHRKSRYEPSVKQKCKQLIVGQGRATAIITIGGLFILIITVLAAFARPGSSGSCETPIQTKSTLAPPVDELRATNGEVYPWTHIRLPSSLEPQTYQIQLQPNFQKKIFAGVVKISINVLDETDRIIMHAKTLNLNSVKVSLIQNNGNQPSTKQLSVEKTLEQTKLEQILILLKDSVHAGDSLHVEIEYTAKLERKLSGFYLSSYNDPEGKTRYLATTQFEPVGARMAFPCFDEPALKANFSLKMVREKKYLSLFNMPKIRTTIHDKDSNLEVDEFEESVKMSTYLVAFIVCDFKNRSSKTKYGTKVNVYAPAYLLDQTEFALDAAVKIMEYYNGVFGVPYPLPKQDLVAVPDFAAGAMENWGLITYRLEDLLYNSSVSSMSNRQRVAVVVAHELAHQWFGNLVTMRWWNDLWLNEGFASFVETLGADRVDPNFKLDQQIVTMLFTAFDTDSYTTSHPISVEVKSPDTINSMFDSISYKKGSSIIRMLKGFLGDQQFKKGLQSYLTKYKYGNARSDDLWVSLSTKQVDVKSVMNAWVNKMGFPLVNVTNNKDGTATFSQKRFLMDKTALAENYIWQIPFWYATCDKNGVHSPELVWIKSTSVTVKIPKNTIWIKGNYGTQGYYRVNYQEEYWGALQRQLLTNPSVFTAVDRAGIMDDVLTLSRSGDVSIEQALEMTKFVENEDNYLVWKSVVKGFGYIHAMFMRDLVLDKFEGYVLKLMKKIIEKIGWTPQSDVFKSHLQKLVLSIAFHYGHKETVNEALKLFKEWKTKDQMIDPNLKTTVYGAGIKYGTSEDWYFMWNKYQTTTVPSEKVVLLRSLCETQDITIIHRLLKYCLNSTMISSQEVSDVISDLSCNPAAQLETWHFVKSNWYTIMNMYRGVSFAVQTIVKDTASDFNTEVMLTEVKDFYATHDAGAGQRQAKSNIERIKVNIQWLSDNKEKVKAWLAKQNESI